MSNINNYLDNSELDNYINGNDEEDVAQTILRLMSTKTNGIEALPYQFMESVDRRVLNTGVGRKYADRIFGRLPLVFLTPCQPLFMDDYDQSSKQAVMEQLLSTGVKINNLSELIGGDGGNSTSRYYSVEFDYTTYYKYLDTMLSCISVYLGIYDTKISVGGKKAKKLGTINWMTETNDAFKTFFSSGENVIFYLDNFNSVSETFTNNTAESSLASQINQFADMSNEIRFLFGKNGNAVANMINSGSEVTSSISQNLSSLATDVAGGIVGSLANKGVNSVLNGGKIIFPKIWGDSDYSRSYNLSIKLRSPDHDNLSIFLNILKPYCKLLALTMPHQLDNNDPNAIGAPFLVKAAAKGMFAVDMGMITSMNVNKGRECAWNDDGLPTEIDIDITIEDMYSKLAMSAADIADPIGSIKNVVYNTAYMDFLATNSGLNILQQEIGRKVTMIRYLSEMTLKSAPNRAFSRVDQGISNLFGRLYNLL